ncbi:hypothetical protein EMGBS15_11340 [Filimonas sp.]|nr:hypothetical protein EMGBS15_11340 [Filimonas sp.]
MPPFEGHSKFVIVKKPQTNTKYLMPFPETGSNRESSFYLWILTLNLTRPSIQKSAFLSQPMGSTAYRNDKSGFTFPPSDCRGARIDGGMAASTAALSDTARERTRRTRALPRMKVRRARTDRALLKTVRERARSVRILRYDFRAAVNRLIGRDVRQEKRALHFCLYIFLR